MPYLNMGEFYSEFGNYDVKITLPENYKLMATGDIINGKEESAWLDSLAQIGDCLLYSSPSPRDKRQSGMPSSA